MKSYKTHVCLYTHVCVWTGENSACLWAWQWVCFVLGSCFVLFGRPALWSQSTAQGLNQEPGTESSEPWPLGCRERPAVSFKYNTKDTAHEGKNRRAGLNEDVKLFYERHWREWENKIQIRRKYLQITFYIKDLHPKYILKNLLKFNNKTAPPKKRSDRHFTKDIQRASKHMKRCSTLLTFRGI